MREATPDINSTRQHWNDQAATYDAAKQRNDVYYRTLKESFSRAVPDDLRSRVLDIGCGTGQILASLNPREGVGIDLSPRMIEIAGRQFQDRPNLRFENLHAGELAVREIGQFDCVISSDTLEHVDDWRAVLVAMHAACRPDGLMVVSTPNPAWTFPLWVLEKLRLKMPEGPHRFVWAGQIAEQLRAMGCTVTMKKSLLMLPINLAGIGPAISQMAEIVPLTNRLGVIQIIAARRSSR